MAFVCVLWPAAASLRETPEKEPLVTEFDSETIHQAVRREYGKIATDASSCCGPCGCVGPETSLALGYSSDDLSAVPDGANLGLGCGNPQAIARLALGETVLDLGSGGGFDCFLAARQVGPTGRVIGVDMTAEMIERARKNAGTLEARNVEFRLGEIEHLPVADDSVDVILSNCVVNLSPDKPAVFREAHRVLAPGGRIAISDVVALGPLPEEQAQSLLAVTGCIAGAAQIRDIERWLVEAGFERVQVDVVAHSGEFIRNWLPGTGIENTLASATIEAHKPTATACCDTDCCGSKARA
jgi:SAM-dependent methyltransferase